MRRTHDFPGTVQPCRARARCRHQRRRREAFLAMLTSDATLTDDGNPRSLHDWIDREIFSAHGHMTVEHEDDDGLRLIARYRNDTWGEMRTFWRFQVTGD